MAYCARRGVRRCLCSPHGEAAHRKMEFFWRQEFFSQDLFWSHIIIRHPHRWLCFENPVFSSKGNAAEALSTQTRGEATWCEVPHGWQVLPALSLAPLEKRLLQNAAGEKKLTTLKYLEEK